MDKVQQRYIDELDYASLEARLSAAPVYEVTTPKGTHFIFVTGNKELLNLEHSDRRFHPVGVQVDWRALDKAMEGLTPEQRIEQNEFHEKAMRGIRWRMLKERLLHDVEVNNGYVLFDEPLFIGKSNSEILTGLRRMCAGRIPSPPAEVEPGISDIWAPPTDEEYRERADFQLKILNRDLDDTAARHEQFAKKPKSFGPPRIGKSGKVRRW